MMLKKGEMTLKVVWKTKINETRRYEQYLITGVIPESEKKIGGRWVRLPKEYFFGQAEFDKIEKRWVENSIRIIRTRPGKNEDSVLEALRFMLWFYTKVTNSTVALIDPDLDIVLITGTDNNKIVKLMNKLEYKKSG